jgi:hypothetical protein
MRRRAVSALGIALAVFLLASCGSSRSDVEAMAARGRTSLAGTFSDTSYRLPPMHSSACLDERQRVVGSDDPYGDAIYCSLDSGAMGHLLRRLDQGLGTDVTAAQRSCINRKITRDQIAALLAAKHATARARAATEADFDGHLASAIRRCTAS